MTHTGADDEEHESVGSNKGGGLMIVIQGDTKPHAKTLVDWSRLSSVFEWLWK